MTEPAPAAPGPVSEPAAEPSPPPISRAKKLLFAGVLLCGFLLVLEVVLRVTHLFGARVAWTEPDPRIGWRFTPGRDYWFQLENDHPITGVINAHGWRDREWTLEKPAGTLRVAVLGDSMVEAFQVEPERTFLALTERQWNGRRLPRIEVMNFGRSGCTQSEELLILEHDVDRFAPDVVVLVFTPQNDIQDVRPETSSSPLRPYYAPSADGTLTLDTSYTSTRGYRVRRFINPFKQHSAIVSLVCERWNAIQEARQAYLQGGAEGRSGLDLSGYLSLCTAKPDRGWAAAYAVNKGLIGAIARHCGERNRKLLIVVADLAAYLPEVEREWKAAEPSLDPNFFEDDLTAFARSLGAEVLGLQRVFRRVSEERDEPLHWAHWNYAGHEVVARELVQALERMLGS